MTITEALEILQACDWLKVTQRHVSAAKYRTREEILIRSAGFDPMTMPNIFRSADVSVRRKKIEAFDAFLIRAAELVASGHVPVVRVPPPSSKDVCACGEKSRDLRWNEQLKQRLCRRCERSWLAAANHNDMRPIGNTEPQ